MKKTTIISSLALGSLLSVTGANAVSPFDVNPLQNAYSSDSKTADAKCGEGKCGEGKCGETIKKPTKKGDAKCGEGKCGS